MNKAATIGTTMVKKGCVSVDGSKELASPWLIRVRGGEGGGGDRANVEGGGGESVGGEGGDLSGHKGGGGGEDKAEKNKVGSH